MLTNAGTSSGCADVDQEVIDLLPGGDRARLGFHDCYTFRDTSQIGPPAVFSALLTVFALPAVFVAAGVGMVAMAWYSRYVPRQY